MRITFDGMATTGYGPPPQGKWRFCFGIPAPLNMKHKFWWPLAWEGIIPKLSAFSPFFFLSNEDISFQCDPPSSGMFGSVTWCNFPTTSFFPGKHMFLSIQSCQATLRKINQSACQLEMRGLLQFASQHSILMQASLNGKWEWRW